MRGSNLVRRADNWLEQFQDEMNDVFQRFFGPATVTTKEGVVQRAWKPLVDVEETDKALIVKADIPGVSPNDVEIMVQDNFLILRGEKKEEKKEEKKNYRRVERFVGKFYREIPLPSGTEPDKITADCSKGVVTITIPKTAEAQPRKITIKAHD